MKRLRYVEDFTKESYKKAICDACDDIKNRVDDILCDFEKSLKNVKITIDVGIGQVSIINITKELAVLGDDDEEGEVNDKD
jgi:hypothetical protein